LVGCDWVEMIKEVDINGDGEVDFEEFKGLLYALVKKVTKAKSEPNP